MKLEEEEGLGDEEFVDYFKKYEEEIEEYNRKHNITSSLTPLQKLESQIACLSVLYVDSNKDKKYGIEVAKLLLKLKEICPGHDYIVFLNYILEAMYLGR